jgi:hypothetical protein
MLRGIVKNKRCQLTPFFYLGLFMSNKLLIFYLMKIILSEAQVKKLLDTLTNGTILEESKKPKTFKLAKSI